jgi:type I restriction enzyme, S subunit
MSRWPLVPLGEVLQHRKEFITIDDEQTYQRCRVQVNAKGIVLRDRASGADIKTKKQQQCRPGEFLVAEIDAKMGGYGLVPDELDGAIVSSHYFLFQPDQSRLNSTFLGWFAKTPAFFAQVAAQGSTNYAAIRPSHVLKYVIPLPPLHMQRRIVAQLDAVATHLAERKAAAAAVEDELAALLRAVFNRLIADAPYARMDDIAPLVRRSVEIDPESNYPELGVRSFGKGTFHKPSLNGIEVGTKRLFRIEKDDLLFNIVFAWEGAVAVARPEDHDRVGSHRFLTCVPDSARATPTFLRYFFLTPEGILKLGEASPGGAGRNRTLGLKALEAIKVPVPSLDKQRWFDRLQTKVAAIRSTHAAAEAESLKLLPALLDRAFSGDTTQQQAA